MCMYVNWQLYINCVYTPFVAAKYIKPCNITPVQANNKSSSVAIYFCKIC
uniref:Uncharacterized protein n=1 Tax=Octopus bimaculoides TaxID=37653 RepID=A0A0L8HAD0_OCTBM